MKQLGFLSIFFILSLVFGCTDNTHVPQPDFTKNVGYVKLLFEDVDGSIEQSSIHAVFNEDIYKGLRASSQELNITEDIVLTEGDYGAVNVKNDVKITIVGVVKFNNFNNNHHKTYLNIKRGGYLYVVSSTNANGSLSINVDGKLKTQGIEMQGENGTGNNLTGSGEIEVEQNFQLSSTISNFDFCGKMKVGHTTSLHNGKFNLCNCAAITTSGLDANRPNLITGEGSITITGNNFNLNHNLTESNKIEIVYCDGDQPKHLNNPSKLGAAKRVCAVTCVPPALPVKYSNLVIKREDNEIKVSMEITENVDFSHMTVLYSTDAVNWKGIGKAVSEELKIGDYSQSFKINKD